MLAWPRIELRFASTDTVLEVNMIGQRHPTTVASRVPPRVLWLLAGLLCMALWLAPGPSFGQSRQLQNAVDEYIALTAQDRYEEALPLAETALRLAENEFGTSDHIYAIVLNNLAENYRLQGFYAAAEPLYRRALVIIEAVLGPENPDAAGILNNMALSYTGAGRYTEAERLFVRSLTIKERALGEGHVDVALTLTNYAMLLRATGRTYQAEGLEERAAAIRANPEEAPRKPVEKKSSKRRRAQTENTFDGP